MSVIEEIEAERTRQRTKEGFDLAHDDEHVDGELALAAIVYIGGPDDSLQDAWPWGGESLKFTTPRRNLIKAAALLVAEIERLDRLPQDA